MTRIMPANSARQGYRFHRPGQVDDLEIVRGTNVQRVLDSHLHDKFEIGLIEQGEALMTIRGVAVELLPGKLFIVNPNEPHETRSENGCSFRLLYVTPERMQQAARDLGLAEAPLFITRAFDDPAVMHALQQLHAAFDRDAPRSEIEVLLGTALGMVATRAPRVEDDDAAVATTHEAVERVRRFIDEHYADPITLDELSQVAGLSKYHLIRVFRASCGMPPHAYQNAVRVARAREALANGAAACDVATAIGFADQSHFTRRFKRLVGVAPGEYARWAAGKMAS